MKPVPYHSIMARRYFDLRSEANFAPLRTQPWMAAVIRVRRKPPDLEDLAPRLAAHNRLRRLAVTTVKQIISRREPERRWLFVIRHNGRDHPEGLLIILARRLVKRHPFAGRRKQR